MWLRHRVLVGAAYHGRAGLGSITTPSYNEAEGEDRMLVTQLWKDELSKIKFSVQAATVAIEVAEVVSAWL